MQLSTLMKFGGLAFDVVQDDKVKELAGMIHKGARRRGFLGDLGGAGQSSGNSAASSEQAHPIPFSPKEEKSEPKNEQKKNEKPAGIHLPPQVGLPTGSFGKYMTANNAQKMKQWAAEIGQYLITK